MGTLLQALGLERQLSPDLSTASDKIGRRADALGLDAARTTELGLKESAAKVARNLTDLQPKVEKRLYDMKKSEFVAVTGFIASRQADGAKLETDAMHLKMLAAETDVALSNSKANRDKLELARTGYAEALVGRVDTGGDLAVDLKRHIDDLVAANSTARLGAAMKALDTLGGDFTSPGSRDARARQAAQTVARQLREESQTRQKTLAAPAAEKAQRSEEKRNVLRVPNDVLVHVMQVVGDALAAYPNDADLTYLATLGKKWFLTHQVGADDVESLARNAEKRLAALHDAARAATCARLAGQLPKVDAASGERAKPTPAQLQDNITGRVFDTRFVAEMVRNPPDELKAASGASGAAFAAGLADTPENQQAAHSVVKHYVIEDKRPWAAAVPAFAEIAKAKNGAESLAAIKRFLSTPPTSGPEIIAFNYLMTKMSVGMQDANKVAQKPPPAWMAAAGANYPIIGEQANRDRAPAAGVKVMSEGAGITLLHQPKAVDNDAVSERPTTANRFGNRVKAGKPLELDQVPRSDAITVQHEHALPYASGVSGSTNILLHLLKDQNDHGANLDNREFLLNAMMFLVYDGGHSMHEVMWTANQVDAAGKLNLGLGLGDPDKPNEFVSDYETFAEGFGGPVKQAVGQAMDGAWAGTQAYLQQNSFFAQ